MNESTSLFSSIAGKLLTPDCLVSEQVIRSVTSAQPLTALPVGSTGIVAEIKVPNEHRCRILEMGLLVGTKVQLVRFAPMGDPLEIKLRGYHLTLRKHEAAQIWIKPA